MPRTRSVDLFTPLFSVSHFPLGVYFFWYPFVSFVLIFLFWLCMCACVCCWVFLFYSFAFFFFFFFFFSSSSSSSSCGSVFVGLSCASVRPSLGVAWRIDRPSPGCGFLFLLLAARLLHTARRRPITSRLAASKKKKEQPERKKIDLLSSWKLDRPLPWPPSFLLSLNAFNWEGNE